jgi:hypothetical protein
MYHIQNISVPKSQTPYCCFTVNTSGLMLSTGKQDSVIWKKADFLNSARTFAFEATLNTTSNGSDDRVLLPKFS